MLCLSISSFAQIDFPNSYGRNERFAFDDADFNYYQGNYDIALDGFMDLYTVDSTFGAINQRIGACLLVLRHPIKKAEVHLQKALSAGFEEALYDMAVVKHRSMKLEQAQQLLSEYSSLTEKDHTEDEISRRREMIKEAQRQLKNPVDVIVKNLGPAINSAAPEYVPIITDNDKTLYFTSRRDDSTAQMKDPNGDYFEDVYVSERDGDGNWSEAKNIGIPINSETHDAVVGTSVDGNKLIIYRTNSNLTGGDLYLTERKGEQWTELKKLGDQINTKDQEASACFDVEGNTLFFSSNRDGGFGGKDLYRVKKLPNGEWSLPKNLGAGINTAFDEDAPFVSADGVMYFASNGHNTMGGFDIFRTERNEKGFWETPENVGYPINTAGDDLFLSIIGGDKKGYFSSDRSGGFGQQDIYEVNFIYRSMRQIVVHGQVIDQNGDGIPADIVVVDDETRSIQGQYRSKTRDGSFILVLNPLSSYTVEVSAEGYSSLKDKIEFDDSPERLREEQISPYLLIKQ